MVAEVSARREETRLRRRLARQMGMNATDMQTLRILDVDGPAGPTELARRLDLRSRAPARCSVLAHYHDDELSNLQMIHIKG
jgi:hypothetical protein